MSFEYSRISDCLSNFFPDVDTFEVVLEQCGSMVVNTFRNDRVLYIYSPKDKGMRMKNYVLSLQRYARQNDSLFGIRCEYCTQFYCHRSYHIQFVDIKEFAHPKIGFTGRKILEFHSFNNITEREITGRPISSVINKMSVDVSSMKLSDDIELDFGCLHISNTHPIKSSGSNM